MTTRNQHTGPRMCQPCPIARQRRKTVAVAALATVGLMAGEVNAQTSIVGAPPVLTHRVAMPVVNH